MQLREAEEGGLIQRSAMSACTSLGFLAFAHSSCVAMLDLPMFAADASGATHAVLYLLLWQSGMTDWQADSDVRACASILYWHRGAEVLHIPCITLGPRLAIHLHPSCQDAILPVLHGFVWSCAGRVHDHMQFAWPIVVCSGNAALMLIAAQLGNPGK